MENSGVMKGEILERKKLRSWHGLEVHITIYNSHWAKTGFLVHPQIANFFMRFGLPEKVRVEMEILHEFGHIQTFPLVLIYYVPFLLVNESGWLNFAVISAGMLLFWELISEIYVLMKYRGYLKIYRNNLHPVTAVYWTVLIPSAVIPFIPLLSSI